MVQGLNDASEWVVHEKPYEDMKYDGRTEERESFLLVIV